MSDLPGSVKFAPDVVLQVIDGEALVLKLTDETVFSLDATGARIAQLIVGGRSVHGIVDVLCSEYGVMPEDVAGDVHDFVRILVARGLAVPSDQGHRT